MYIIKTDKGFQLVIDSVGAQETSAAGGKLECLDGEGEVLIIGVVDEEAVIDGLLQALGLVTHRNFGAILSCGETILHAGALSESFVVKFNFIHNNAPLPFGVLSAERPDIGCFRGAQVSFFIESFGSFNGKLSV